MIHRDEQIAQLRRDFDTCEQFGHGHVVLVTGSVGSGKTQVLETFGAWATTVGGHVLTATGSRAEQGLHFGVLGQLMHSARLAGEATTHIEELIREAANSLPTEETRRGAADVFSAEGPFWAPLLHNAFTMLLGMANQGPLVLVVDDVQHSDPASLHCLLYMIRRLRHAPIMVLLSESPTLRPAHPLFHAELRSQPRLTHISLPPLTVDAIARLLPQSARGDDVREEARRLLHMTGGNPLLTQALVDERAHHDADGAPVAGLRGPDTFDRAVLGSLYRHERSARLVAQALAVLNRPASPELLGQLLDMLPDSVVPALRVLHSSGLAHAGQLRHPRVLRSVLSDTPAEEQRTLHQRAAKVLHEHGADSSVVAEHLVASAWTDGSWAVPVLRDAAEGALSSGRPDLSVAYLRLAAGAEPDERRRNSLRAMLVNARWQVNPLAVNGDLGELVKAARGEACTMATAISTVPYLLWQGRAEEAVEAVTSFDDDGPVAGRLQVMRLLVALSHPDYLVTVRETQSSWSRAATVPHSVSPPLQAMSVLGSALIPTDGVDTVSAAEQLLQRHHVDRGALGLLAAPLLALLCAGRADRVVVWGDLLLSRPEAQHIPAWRAVIRAIRAEAALRLGDLATAEQEARTALEDLPAPAWGVAVGGPLGTLITCATETGRYVEADRWLTQPVPPGMFRTPVGAHYLLARGSHHLAMGRPQAASSDLHACGTLVRGWGLDVAGLVPWRVELARVQLDLGNRTNAAQLLREQLQVPHGLDDRTRGRALQLLASTGAAPDHRHKLLSKAVDLFQSCGDRQGLARALADTSEALQEAGAPVQARQFLGRADQLARDSGVAALLPQRAEPRHPPGHPPGEAAEPHHGGSRKQDELLSEAEHRVALLAAQGHTNRQISDELFITVSTVEQHLTRVYRKLGVRRRTDLPNRFLAAERWGGELRDRVS
nr:LuxR family transcriptional regulator [Streptomyces boncukensis]